MTTIVASRTAIWADSNCGYVVPFGTGKVFSITVRGEGSKDLGAEYLVGGAGISTEIKFLTHLLEENGLSDLWKFHMSDHWPPRILKSADSDLIVVTRDKQLFLLDKDLLPLEIKDDYYAIGSGCQYAMSALKLGRSPEEAVLFACDNDPYSKGPVTSLKFPRRSAAASK